VLQHTSVHCNVLQRTASYVSLRHSATRCNTLQHMPQVWYTWCNTLQHTATHICNKLRHNATHASGMVYVAQYTATHCNAYLQHAAKHTSGVCCAVTRQVPRGPACISLQHAATHCNTYFRYGVCCTVTRQVPRGSACISLEHADTLQHTATRCNTHTATHISGMVYVALSRVKSLEGLRLHGFAPAKVCTEHTHINIHIYPLICVKMYTYRCMFLIYI